MKSYMKTLIASYDTYIIDTMLIYIYDHIAWCNIVSYHRISLYTIAPTDTLRIIHGKIFITTHINRRLQFQPEGQRLILVEG